LYFSVAAQKIWKTVITNLMVFSQHCLCLGNGATVNIVRTAAVTAKDQKLVGFAIL
jgi:hypothetical protein